MYANEGEGKALDFLCLGAFPKKLKIKAKWGRGSLSLGLG